MKILIADDNHEFLKILTDLLKLYGHTPLPATNGKEGLQILDTNKVDVVISDVYMPEVDGVQLHARLRSNPETKNIPFIFISGYSNRKGLEPMMDSEHDYFVAKGTSIISVAQILEKASVQQPSLREQIC